MIHIHKHKYEYMEEVNTGIVKCFKTNKGAEKPLVLDVGCGNGALSEAIQQMGYSVWGIEIYKPAADAASQKITKVINADISKIEEVKALIGNQKFDYIVFSDVLEHIYDPYSLLFEYLSFLKESGSVCISVPNALAWTNRIAFLFGVFNYADTGIMDRTHIRFFTFRTAKRLVKAAGLRIAKVDYTPYFIRALTPLIKKLLLKDDKIEDTDRKQLVDSPYYKMYQKYIYPIEYIIGFLFKGLFAFRIIIVGKKQDIN